MNNLKNQNVVNFFYLALAKVVRALTLKGDEPSTNLGRKTLVIFPFDYYNKKIQN
jgi:hypothetical protein